MQWSNETIARKAGDSLRAAESRLTNLTDTPRLDAELLLAHAWGISRASLLARMGERVPADVAEKFEGLLARRLDHEPLAYIFGEWEFFSLPMIVRPPALVPRPETEHLVEAALAPIQRMNESGRDSAEHGSRVRSPSQGAALRVADVGTGTGCVAVAIAVNAPNAVVTATDINQDYLKLARENAQRHHVADRMRFLQGDLLTALPDAAKFDVIVSNPPYVETGAWDELPPVIRIHEDPRALLAGADGLDCVRQLIADAPKYLRSGGLLAIEIGMGQYGAVKALFEQRGYDDVRSVKDLAGIDRIACGNYA